jgi:peptide/nickel transport system permease protein
MTGFIARRAVSGLLLLLAVSFIIFSFIHIAPGDPVTVLLGGHDVTPEQIHAVREHYRLNDPLLVQYTAWLENVAHGDFGESISGQAPVSQVVEPRIVPTLELAAYAWLLVVIIGCGGGIAAAVKRGKAVDVAISATTLVGSSLAPYVSGIVLIVVFSATLQWFPVFGSGSGFSDRLYHLTLPAIALAVSLSAFVGRITRSAMIEALQLEYVDTARSRGAQGRRVVLKHALRAALVPIVTVVGLSTGYLLTGTVVVEYTFGLNGLGSELVDAIQANDFAVVQAIALLFTLAFTAVNLCADVLYLVIDPRVRAHRDVSPLGG